MTQEDKELILIDLCARLPYRVKVKHKTQDFSSTLLWVDTERLSAGIKADKIGVGSDWGNIEFIKPYLRPMSSMTKEEYVYFMSIYDMNLRSYEIQKMIYENLIHSNIIDIVNTSGKYSNKIDWLNAHHFDYRGLIERGLAIAVTKDNNPYK